MHNPDAFRDLYPVLGETKLAGFAETTTKVGSPQPSPRQVKIVFTYHHSETGDWDQIFSIIEKMALEPHER